MRQPSVHVLMHNVDATGEDQRSPEAYGEESDSL